MRRDVFCDDATSADDSAFIYCQCSAGAACCDRVRSHECLFLNYHMPSSARMGDNYSPDADLNTVMNFDVLRIFIVEVNIASDKHILSDPGESLNTPTTFFATEYMKSKIKNGLNPITAAITKD